MEEEDSTTGIQLVTEKIQDDEPVVVDSGMVDKNEENIQDDILRNFPGVDITGSLKGLRGNNFDEFEALYKKHAVAVGFRTRKGTQRMRFDKVSERYFHCSCAGKKTKDKDELSITPSPHLIKNVVSQKRKRTRTAPLTRTNCKAQIRIKWNKKTDLYEVVSHVMDHNHPLFWTEWKHFNQSERSITEENGMPVIEMEASSLKQSVTCNYSVHSAGGEENGMPVIEMEASGLKQSVTCNYSVHSAGGEENVGQMKNDHMNFMNRLKMKDLEGSDAQKVVDMLTQLDEDPNFFFKVKLDDDGKLCGIFWRDGLAKEHYMLYGDVVVLDTTCNTNKYNWICAPFVGVNNHCNNVMLGCAFLGNENAESFIWLLKVFRESMGGKAPKMIFTDQDLAISNAMVEVFKEATRHRLCLRQIQQNVISHFGELNTNTQFKEEFDHCLKGCSNKEEFENCWKSMLKTYGLEGNPWFENMYGLRSKWCTALSKDFFSTGFLSSQRTESTVNTICFDATRTTSLTQFFDIFFATAQHWRSTEKQKELQCSRSIPKTNLKTCLLKHAADVYTLSIFKYFEKEFRISIGTTISTQHVNYETTINTVALEEDTQKSERVTFSTENGKIRVKCSCKHFEEVGWLCFHCLRVLHFNNVSQIPSEYILRRWTKFAKVEVWEVEVWDTVYKNPSNREDLISWRQQMLRKFHNLLLKSEGNAEARKTIEDVLDKASLAVQEILSGQP